MNLISECIDLIDIDLTDYNHQKLQNSIYNVNFKRKKYGMNINQKKTKTMVFCLKEEDNKLKMKLEDEERTNVGKFKYLKWLPFYIRK